MAKKKSSKRSVHPLHKHHSFSRSIQNRPGLTLGVIILLILLLGIIYLTLFTSFNYAGF